MYRQQEIRCDWSEEIPEILNKITELENELFDGLEPYAQELLMMNEGKTKVSLKTKLTMKKIKWNKDYRLVKIDEKTHSLAKGEIDIDEIDDPGPCPQFVFMPTKVQLMKMILKAAY